MPAYADRQPNQARIVASLAAECHVPVGEMATLYEQERAKLAVGARITDFLHILATRKVLDILRLRDKLKPIWQSGAPTLRAV